ncbi:MAG: precorrin-3B C(17)-methyltransferase [Caldimicrobium sp.]
MQRNKEIFLIYLSEKGKEVGERVQAFLGAGELFNWKEIKEEGLANYWKEDALLIFIMALGIVARICAPYISKKGEDPGVIVIDEAASNVIPYLGGHYAHSNKIALEIAQFLGAHSCITTASDLQGLPAIDLWIKKEGFALKNPNLLPHFMSKLNLYGKLKIWVDEDVDNYLTINLLPCLHRVENIDEADVIITFKNLPMDEKLVLIPKKIWAGIGFHERLTTEELEEKFIYSLQKFGYDLLSLKGIATIKKKSNYLPLTNFALKHNIKLLGIETDKLSEIKTLSSSENVKSRFGISSVSEASAIYASRGKLIIPKQIYEDFTLALAVEQDRAFGKLYVVGIGPGNLEYLTIKALKVLTSVEAVVGYRSYLRQIEPLLSGKEVYAFSMTEELKRVKKAVELTLMGKDTALVSGGDPGIYGMSGLLLEYLHNQGITLDIEIIPGISALNMGNALLGAPLANDFAVISLSDRLMPWEKIVERLSILAKSDIPIVIYNPTSKTRKKQFEDALSILKKYRPLNTYVAIINSASREDERIYITTLESVDEEQVNMQSLLIVGSCAVKKIGSYLVAERGYERKYSEELKGCSSS